LDEHHLVVETTGRSLCLRAGRAELVSAITPTSSKTTLHNTICSKLPVDKTSAQGLKFALLERKSRLQAAEVLPLDNRDKYLATS